MTILQSSADYDKVYYVEYQGVIRQCRLIATQGRGHHCEYRLEVAGVGEVLVPFRPKESDRWWYCSKVQSILAESPEDLRRGKYLEDSYGTTQNAYNERFLQPFFPNYKVCICGGGIIFWEWDGVRARCYYEKGEFPWFIDREGFHCSINAPVLTEGRYGDPDECERANTPEVITF